MVIDMAKPLSDNFIENLNTIKNDIGSSWDVVIREMTIGEKVKLKTAVIYVDGLADKSFIQDFIVKTLMIEIRNVDLDRKYIEEKDWFEVLKDISISVAGIKEVKDIDDLYLGVLSGDTIILIDNSSKAFLVGSKGWKGRSVEEPTTETAIKGPKEGFTENISINTALIRRRIKNKNLMIENIVVGKDSNTDIAIVYINGIVDEKVLNEVRSRINKIDVDYIIDSGNIDSLIRDSKYSVYPTIYTTERPDALSSGLLQGRVAILVDGNPFCLLVPALFVHFFQTSADYSNEPSIATFLRIVRYIAYFVALLTPGVYTAFLSYHQEMIPTPLFISIAAQREGVPFPSIIEILLLQFIFEILTEAAIRMPRIISPTISIVGTLVIGQAAVEAGIFSPILIIAVAVTAVATNTSTKISMTNSVRVQRFIFILLGAAFGMPGIVAGMFVLTFYLCGLTSFGVPYMSSIAPFDAQAQKDVVVRLTSDSILKHKSKKWFNANKR